MPRVTYLRHKIKTERLLMGLLVEQYGYFQAHPFSIEKVFRRLPLH